MIGKVTTTPQTRATLPGEILMSDVVSGQWRRRISVRHKTNVGVSHRSAGGYLLFVWHYDRVKS